MPVKYYHLSNGKNSFVVMNVSGRVETLRATPSFMNYWVDEGVCRNREPMRHAEIMHNMKIGKILVIPNPGSISHCYFRN